MGFKLGKGWDHEVWVYNGEFWVHYGGYFSGIKGRQISGDEDMKKFFAMFIKAIRDITIEPARVVLGSV